ncbi:HAD family hydrolase [Alkalilimnicola ehrlichii]|uniref:HAD family hydrolase n=1 Tax=Alkalilimnicola ehrlichii TaxID=351052 RepID=UPI003B9FB89D
MPESGAIRAVTFDLDFTLWDLEHVIQRAEQRMQRFLAARYPRVSEHFDEEAMRRLRLRMAEEHPELRINVSAMRRASLRRIALTCGYGEDMVEAAFHVFMEGRHEVVPYDDVAPTLTALRRHYRIGALTNGNADVNRLALGEYFDFSVSAVEVGAAKPSRIIFEAACHRAGIPPGEMVHVGDEVHSDVLGAVRFGMGAVWLNRRGEPWPEDLERLPHVELADLSRLPAVLARWH